MTEKKMVVTPKVRGFICTAAHPEGCARSVQTQIDYVKQQQTLPQDPKNVLIIGSSTGYGLATRITAAFGAKSSTLGICFERPASGKRTASAGWYNTAAFEKKAQEEGLYCKTLNGDAFSKEMKQKIIDTIKKDLGQIDAVIYSLASPRRTDPETGEVYQSVLKTVGDRHTDQSVDPMTGILKQVTLDAATPAEIDQTVAVMGGDDLQIWIDELLQANVLATGTQVIAYSYIGPELTYPIYKDGTIGKAKDHLKATCDRLDQQLQSISGSACIAINKAVVTQASAAIPIVPLYFSILFKVMKEKNIHEGCIEQMYRLAHDYIYTKDPKAKDQEGRIRIDDWEMRDDIQTEVSRLWSMITADNLDDLTDLVGYQEDFFKLFGFRWPEIDYEKECDVATGIPSIKDEDNA